MHKPDLRKNTFIVGYFDKRKTQGYLLRLLVYTGSLESSLYAWALSPPNRLTRVIKMNWSRDKEFYRVSVISVLKRDTCKVRLNVLLSENTP